MPKAIIVSEEIINFLWKYNSHKTACGGVLYFDDYLVINKAIDLTNIKLKQDFEVNGINELRLAIKKYEHEN
jgi:hypothetical protein